MYNQQHDIVKAKCFYHRLKLKSSKKVLQTCLLYYWLLQLNRN